MRRDSPTKFFSNFILGLIQSLRPERPTRSHWRGVMLPHPLRMFFSVFLCLRRFFAAPLRRARIVPLSVLAVLSCGLCGLHAGTVVTGNDPGSSYANTNTIAPTAPVDLAQSFTATKTGLLTVLTVYGTLPSGSATLNIYSGDGTGGTLLRTQSLSPFNISGTADSGNNRYIPTAITLNTPVSIT